MYNSSYPNAAKGLKWVFIAEILAIVSIPLAFILVGAITAIVSVVMNLVGLNNAASDDANYRPAFLGAVAALVISVLSGFAGNGVLGTVLSIVTSLVNLFIVYTVCTVTSGLLTGKAPDVAGRGATVTKIYLVCAVVNVACSVLSAIPALGLPTTVIATVSGIAALVGYIMYLIFLWGASKALA